VTKTHKKTDKQAVANAFGKAVDSYDQFAGFQRDVGQHLLSLLPQGDLGCVLDLGCGTGHFSQSLLSKESILTGHHNFAQNVIALDLAPEMAKRARQRHANISSVVADADQLPLQNLSIDHALSSLVLQWCDDLAKPLAELNRVVKGTAVFSTLLHGSLSELAQSWQQVDGQTHINEFMTQADVESALFRAGIDNFRLEVQAHPLYFDNAKAVMQQLKGIGANHRQLNEGQQNQGLGGVHQLKAMYGFYEQLRTSQGLPVTYQVCYVAFNAKG